MNSFNSLLKALIINWKTLKSTYHRAGSTKTSGSRTSEPRSANSRERSHAWRPNCWLRTRSSPMIGGLRSARKSKISFKMKLYRMQRLEVLSGIKYRSKNPISPKPKESLCSMSGSGAIRHFLISKNCCAWANIPEPKMKWKKFWRIRTFWESFTKTKTKGTKDIWCSGLPL